MAENNAEWNQGKWNWALMQHLAPLGTTIQRWGTSQLHSRDQLIGILREVEDGADPHKGDRRHGHTDMVEQTRWSHSAERDTRDAELGWQVDTGGFRVPPGDRLAPLNDPSKLI